MSVEHCLDEVGHPTLGVGDIVSWAGPWTVRLIVKKACGPWEAGEQRAKQAVWAQSLSLLSTVDGVWAAVSSSCLYNVPAKTGGDLEL